MTLDPTTPGISDDEAIRRMVSTVREFRYSQENMNYLNYEVHIGDREDGIIDRSSPGQVNTSIYDLKIVRQRASSRYSKSYPRKAPDNMKPELRDAIEFARRGFPHAECPDHFSDCNAARLITEQYLKEHPTTESVRPGEFFVDVDHSGRVMGVASIHRTHDLEFVCEIGNNKNAEEMMRRICDFLNSEAIANCQQPE